MSIDGSLSTATSQLKRCYTTGERRRYYYYNEHFRYRDAVEVVVETSSYPALMSANATGIVQKLVFHSNGQLCGDWDPDTFVIGRFA